MITKKLTAAEVARRTGRSRAAVSAAVRKGDSLEEVLARPKGRHGHRRPHGVRAGQSAAHLRELVGQLSPLAIESLGPPERPPGVLDASRFVAGWSAPSSATS